MGFLGMTAPGTCFMEFTFESNSVEFREGNRTSATRGQPGNDVGNI